MGRTVAADGVGISWTEWAGGGGDGPGAGPGDAAGAVPVVLQHGFVSSTVGNWVNTGVVDALRGAGRRVVGIDARGHGRSDAPHDPALYGEATMARDVRAVVDDLGVDTYDLVGYSMGAIVALLTAAADPRVRRLVVGGVGAGVVELGGLDTRHASREALVDALLAQDPSTLDPAVAGFRRMADANGSDRKALAAHAAVRHAEPVDLAAITADTLVIAGDADPLAVRPEVLVDAIATARLALVHGDHLRALADPRFVEELREHVGRA